MNIRQNKGITLIALIITVIVMLILAGVSMSSINNGLFDKTKQATELYNNSVNNEESLVGGLQNMLQNEIQKINSGSKGDGTSGEAKGDGTSGEAQGDGTSGGAKVNKPILKGMQPVRWNGTTEDTSITEDSSNWYAYIAGDNSTDSKNSMWANAKTADGSYWVWIPRYAYKIIDKPAAADPQTGSGIIEIVFLDGTTNQYDDNGTMRDAVADGYTVHPAFTFGSTQLTGFWVGKYESSSVEGNTNNATGDNVTTKTIQIKPNVSSWRNIDTSTIFENCYTMASKATYGWTGVSNGDTHMMKNIEWGAVAYLAHSQYGRNRNEITMNDSGAYITGTGGEDASTTGNIYGVYDMSGGANESVASNLDGFVNLAGAVGNFDTIYNSADDTLKNKFFDIYAAVDVKALAVNEREPNYQLNSTKKGDAQYETSTSGGGSVTSWFSAVSSMLNSDSPWTLRGGSYKNTDGTSAGGHAGLFYFSYGKGDAWDQSSFRVVLAVSQ
ncbi:MAG: hypothetical protein FWF46_07480 [Oscillospiraceae bacterium]|nr:hypothetical protein [Oscillospiraceae bacterium]